MGGTFNPIHFGHLLMAETALNQFQLDQVIWVPTFHPPHKSTDLLPFGHRWEMVQRSIADHPDFTASNIEMKRQGTSYAIATLNELQELHPEITWYWIIGTDAFQSLPQWQHSANIADRCVWLVAPRDHTRTQQVCQTVADQFTAQSVQLDWHVLQMPQVDISSSLIRTYCQQGRSIRYLVPETVRIYINTNNLYKGMRAIISGANG